MLEITIVDENKAVADYKVNYEDVKNALATELKKYENVVVTEEYMQMAKKSRAELNAMKKDLATRLSEVRNAQLAPYEMLKTTYIEPLNEMIDKNLNKIDEAIKKIEKEKAEAKNKEIKAYFDQKNSEAGLEIPLNQLFNPKWSNQTYSMNKVKADIDVFFVRVVEDLKIIDSFDDEFIIPLRKLYLACFDMSVVMKNKVEFDREKQKKLEAEAEAERLRKELAEKEKAQAEAEAELTYADDEMYPEGLEEEIGEVAEEIIIPDDTEGDLTGGKSIPEENIPEDEIPPQEMSSTSADGTQIIKNGEVVLEYIEFWVRVTPEQKLKLRECVLENHIKCGKLAR